MYIEKRQIIANDVAYGGRMYMNNKHCDDLLAKNIKMLRKKRGITQDKLAEELGYSNRQTVTQWETGNSEPTLSMLKRLCIYFNVSAEYLLGLTKWTHVENESISELTGLSDESIEVLRELKSRHTSKTVLENGTLDFINYELERIYSDYFPMTEEKREYRIYSIFSVMNEYINSSPDMIVRGMNDNGKWIELYSDELTFTYTNDEGIVDNMSRVLKIEELYSASRLNKITHTLTQYKEKKGGKHNG
jgi:transcriptional regulator with XRE-family HTH domain